MDLTSIINSASAALPFPWSLLVGAAVIVAYQWAKVKFPSTLNALPHLVPLPATPPADPSTPTPATPTPAPAHPILNAILGTILGKSAPPAASLADELKSLFAPPQPSTPVSAPAQS